MPGLRFVILLCLCGSSIATCLGDDSAAPRTPDAATPDRSALKRNHSVRQSFPTAPVRKRLVELTPAADSAAPIKPSNTIDSPRVVRAAAPTAPPIADASTTSLADEPARITLADTLSTSDQQNEAAPASTVPETSSFQPPPANPVAPPAPHGEIVPASYELSGPAGVPPELGNIDVSPIFADQSLGCCPTGDCGGACGGRCGRSPAPWKIPCRGVGIGHERVMFAPFFTDLAEPLSHFELQLEHGWGNTRPDRSEFFWAAPTTGPGGDASVDATIFTARLEMAVGERTSTIFEAPLRSVNPTSSGNTTGLGDLVAGGKVVLVNGRDWTITQQTLTHIATGPSGRGLGKGALTIEPGLLARYRWSDDLYLHGQLRYFIPTTGTDEFPGEVLVWGVGTSWIWHETDAFAVIPTFEIVGTSFLDGQQSLPNGTAVDVDGETTVEFLPGVRFVLGPEGDLGLPELGVSGGFSAGDDGWFDARLQFSARWNF